MITVLEVARALTGAWRVFVGAPDAMRHFDTSVEGFWRSFRAILLIAPIYALTSLAEFRATEALLPPGTPLDGTLFFWEQVATLALDWVTLPLLLAGLAGFLGVRATYPAFIVVRNWATVMMIIPFAAISILDAFGLLPGDVIVIPSLIALGFAFRTMYMAARIALQARWDVAAGIVVLDFLVSLLIVRLVARVFGLPG